MPKPDEYKTVKITQSTYDLVQKLKHLLLTTGIGHLPPAVKAELDSGLTVSSVITAACTILQSKVKE